MLKFYGKYYLVHKNYHWAISSDEWIHFTSSLSVSPSRLDALSRSVSSVKNFGLISYFLHTLSVTRLIHTYSVSNINIFRKEYNLLSSLFYFCHLRQLWFCHHTQHLALRSKDFKLWFTVWLILVGPPVEKSRGFGATFHGRCTGT